MPRPDSTVLGGVRTIVEGCWSSDDPTGPYEMSHVVLLSVRASNTLDPIVVLVVKRLPEKHLSGSNRCTDLHMVCHR